nr:hypothetical protein CFP56_22274 [Quercus suber]
MACASRLTLQKQFYYVTLFFNFVACSVARPHDDRASNIPSIGLPVNRTIIEVGFPSGSLIHCIDIDKSKLKFRPRTAFAASVGWHARGYDGDSSLDATC